jgi:AraC-like DNA-binding protein
MGLAHDRLQWQVSIVSAYSLLLSEALQKLPSLPAAPPDLLAIALQRKAERGRAGAAEGTPVAIGDGWRIVDIVCTSGPEDRPFEERHASASISLVLTGTFVYRSERGSSLMSAGSLLLGDAGDAFECSHPHGEGDRCLSFQFDPEMIGRLAQDAGSTSRFGRDRLPPLRALAPLTARVRGALGRPYALEELAVELAGAVVQMTGPAREARSPAQDLARIAPVLRYLETRIAEPCTLAELASLTGLSRYHFLRSFKHATGTTPHQWLLRARLRESAQRLTASRDPVTQIALDVGFDDLSNFIRTFRAEFGKSPTRYRASAA